MAKGNHRVRDLAELYSFRRTGEVHGMSTWSETSIQATTSHSHQNWGSSSSTSISSASYEKQRFFLRRADGEDEVTLTDAGIAFRDGHQITLIYCGHKADQTGWPMGSFNYDTGRRAVFKKSIDWIIPKPSGKMGWLIVVFGLLALRSPSFWILASGVACYMIYNGLLRKRLRAGIHAEIDRQLDEAGNQRPSLVTDTALAIEPAAA